jgi:ribosomal protein S18 acetylase RimI-like enzyme
MIILLAEFGPDSPFFDLMGEVEAGRFFKRDNPAHVEWLKAKVAAHIARGAKFFGLYLDDNTPAGFYALLTEDPVEGIPWVGRRSELLDIAVMPQFRGKRYGTELLCHAEEEAAARGAQCVDLSATAFDPRVIQFYLANGYGFRAVFNETYGPNSWSDIWMRKLLGR